VSGFLFLIAMMAVGIVAARVIFRRA